MGRANTPHKILVIEPDADARHLAGALFEESGLAVVEAETSEAALAVLAEAPYDIAMVFAAAEAERPGAARLAGAVAARWPWIRVVVAGPDAVHDAPEMPPTATLMPRRWRAMDLLREAERAKAA